MLTDSQMKQVVCEAFYKFVENKYEKYSESFTREYVEEVNQWQCFDQYVRKMPDRDIDEILCEWIEEPTYADDKQFRDTVYNECTKVMLDNAKYIFATSEIARIMIGV